jgi:hypothetical protein
LAPTIPSNCPEKLCQLMKMCWMKQPEQRPVSLPLSLSLSLFSCWGTLFCSTQVDFPLFKISRVLKLFVQY